METNCSSCFQARLLRKESLKLKSEVEKLKLKVNKHKAFTKLYKNKFDLLQPYLEDMTYRQDKAIIALTNRVKEETHWMNMYLKHGKTIFL